MSKYPGNILTDNAPVYNPASGGGGNSANSGGYPGTQVSGGAGGTGNYWVAPQPFPTDGKFYLWDEDNFAWESIEIEAFK